MSEQFEKKVGSERYTHDPPLWADLLGKCNFQCGPIEIGESFVYTPVTSERSQWLEPPPIEVQLDIEVGRGANWVFTCDDLDKLERFRKAIEEMEEK